MIDVTQPPAVHSEYLIAKATGSIIFGLWSAEDSPWRETKARQFKAYRQAVKARCASCKGGPDTAVDKAMRTVCFQYIKLPPATRAAGGLTKPPVAYWVGQCPNCRFVYWAADDGEPSEAARD